MPRASARAIGAALVLAALAWPAAGHASDASVALQVDPGHTGFLQGGTLDRPPLTTKWSKSLGTSLGTPLVSQGRVFVPSYDDQHRGATLTALDATTGATLWWRPMDGSVQLALDGTRLFALSNGGLMTAMDAATGDTLWAKQLSQPNGATAPIARGGIVYAGLYWSGGSVSALDESDGHLLWSRNDIYFGGTPAADGTAVYESDGYYCSAVGWNLRTGARIFHEDADCWTLQYRAVATGAWLAADARLLDPADGNLLDSVVSSQMPAFAGNTEVALNGSTLQGRDVRHGTGLWQFAGDGSLSSSPLIVDNTAYEGSSHGQLYAVDLATGAQVWSTSLGTTAVGGPGMAAGSGVLLVPVGGTLTALAAGPARPGLDVGISSGPDGPTSSSSAQLSFGVSGPAAGYTVQCRVDAGSWNTCSSPVSLSGLADGPHTLEVQTRDTSGNAIGLAARGWSVDTTPPVTTLTGGPSGTTRSTSASFTVGAGDAVETDCALDGTAWQPCSGTVSYYNLPDGTHVLRERGTDGMGNVESPGQQRSWVVDTTPPETTITDGPSGTTSSQSASFSFSSNEGGATFQCSLDGATFASCASPATYNGLQTGSHRFDVRATDAAGNTDPSAATRSWTIADQSSDTTTTASPQYASSSPTASYSATSAPTPTTTSPQTGGAATQARPSDAPYVFDGSAASRATPAAALRNLAGAVKEALTGVSLADLLQPGALQVALDAPESGVVTLTLSEHSGRAAAAGVGTRVLAMARVVVRRDAVALVRVHLTGHGRTLAHHGVRRVPATLRVRFTPTSGAPVTATRGVVVGAHAKHPRRH